MTKQNKNNTVPTEAQRVSELVDQLKPMTEIERTLAQLRRVIARPGYAKDRQVREAMLLLLVASTSQSADLMQLVELTGLPKEFVSKVADGMRAAGLDGVDSRRWLDEAGWLKGTVLMEEALTCLGETTRAAQWRELNRRIV